MRRDRTVDARTVIAACEAMLEGRYVEQLEAWGSPVPSWAWINLLAHATAEALEQAANERMPRRLRRTDVWFRARRYLAGEVLDAAAQRGTLRSVQAEILVPLELELLSRRRSRPPAPGEWAAWVMSAIERHRP